MEKFKRFFERLALAPRDMKLGAEKRDMLDAGPAFKPW